jgi:hypothetical protein
MFLLSSTLTSAKYQLLLNKLLLPEVTRRRVVVSRESPHAEVLSDQSQKKFLL